MGTVFKKRLTRPIPAGAVVVGGKARWRPRGSTRSIVAEVRRLPDGREVVDVETSCYYAKYTDADGEVVVKSTGCREESNALRWLSERERRSELVKVGVLSASQARAADNARDGLGAHFAAYADSIRGKRGGPPSPVHVANVRRYLAKLAGDCGWRRLGDLTRESLDAWIKVQQRPGPDGRAMRSAASINRHRTAAKAFAAWAASPDVGRIPRDPFNGVKAVDEDADPRRRRRALTPDELAALCQAARSSKPYARAKLSGPERAELWLFLAATGLRAGEARALRCSDARLDAVPPHLTIPAAVAKSRRDESVPIRSDVLPMLAGRLDGKAPDDPVFIVPRDVGKRFDADCKRAGVPKRDARGRTVDVHSLRHTFISNLQVAGVSPRIAMQLARHSRIELTMSVYTDPALLPTAAALESTIPAAPDAPRLARLKSS